MQITEQQLKEIAKAGYHNIESTRYSNVEYILDEIDNGKISKNLNRNVLYFGGMGIEVSIKPQYVNINAGAGFNHLAAIRKMEELGLIEK